MTKKIKLSMRLIATICLLLVLTCIAEDEKEAIETQKISDAQNDILEDKPGNKHKTAYGDEVPKHRLGEWEYNIGFFQAIELIENSKLYETKSEYQDIEVHLSKFYGKVLLLDGALQLTERDADSYNEMMAHIPMFQHPNPKNVLVLGGGDGYALTEVLKHDVTTADHVDLDKEVVETCKKFFPQWDSWDDPRVKLHISDGAKFVQDITDGTYDVIVQDSSDPFEVEADGTIKPLPSGALYEKDHFCSLFRILKSNGILMIQGESYNIPSNLDGVSTWRDRMTECGFTRVRYGSIMTSSYPTGQIGFLLAEKNPSAAASHKSIVNRFNEIVRSGKRTTYYHPPLQESCFHLPLWVHEQIYFKVDSSFFSQLKDYARSFFSPSYAGQYLEGEM
jgi:spermidine synthase